MNETMQVLIADDDPSFRSFVLQALEGTDFEAIDITLDPSGIATPNSILIVGGSWASVHLSGIAGGNQAVLVALEASSADGVERALLSGADDAFVKPLPRPSLLARLQVARHRMAQASTSQSPRRCLEDALGARLTGAVVVRSHESSGSIHVHNGKISWVERRGHTTSLTTMLARAGIHVDADTCDAVLREARALDQHFTRILADWHVCSEIDAKNAVRAYVVEELGLLLEASKASVMFAPYDTWRAGKLAFEPDEVFPQRVAESGVVPLATRTGMRTPITISGLALASFRNARQVPGCVAAALFDRAGTLLGSDGEAQDPQLAWYIVHTMHAIGRMLTIEDETHVHFARSIDETAVLLVTFSLKEISLGMARMSLTQACAKAAEGDHAPLLAEGALALGASMNRPELSTKEKVA